MSSPTSSSKPKAIHFGAGNIGRGFIGPLLVKSGYHVVFADVNEELIKSINEEHQYDVHIFTVEEDKSKGSKDSTKEETEPIEDFSGVLSNSNEVVDLIAEPSLEIITTAVGVGILPKIAPTLAAGLKKRAQSSKGKKSVLNVIACENAIGATQQLSKAVSEAVSKDSSTEEVQEIKGYIQSTVGWANCSVDRIVPPFETSAHHGLDVGVESFFEWVVDGSSLKPSPETGKPPQIEGVKVTDNLLAYNERKLFTLNAGHAITAYLGRLRGHPDIATAIADENIRRVVRTALLEESGAALRKKHGFKEDEHAAYIDKIIGRFENRAVKDDLTRVGKQPLRKLGKQDRLVGPARMCVDEGIEIDNLSLGIAGALRYSEKGDEQSEQLQKDIKEKGIETVVEELTGFKKGDKTNKGIVKAYEELGKWGKT